MFSSLWHVKMSYIPPREGNLYIFIDFKAIIDSAYGFNSINSLIDPWSIFCVEQMYAYKGFQSQSNCFIGDRIEKRLAVAWQLAVATVCHNLKWMKWENICSAVVFIIQLSKSNKKICSACLRGTNVIIPFSRRVTNENAAWLGNSGMRV